MSSAPVILLSVMASESACPPPATDAVRLSVGARAAIERRRISANAGVGCTCFCSSCCACGCGGCGWSTEPLEGVPGGVPEFLRELPSPPLAPPLAPAAAAPMAAARLAVAPPSCERLRGDGRGGLPGERECGCSTAAVAAAIVAAAAAEVDPSASLAAPVSEAIFFPSTVFEDIFFLTTIIFFTRRVVVRRPPAPEADSPASAPAPAPCSACRAGGRLRVDPCSEPPAAAALRPLTRFDPSGARAGAGMEACGPPAMLAGAYLPDLPATACGRDLRPERRATGPDEAGTVVGAP